MSFASREGAQDVIDIAENVGIHILLGQGEGLERRVGDAQDLESVSHWDQGISGSELVGSVKAVPVPDEYMIVNDDRLHLLPLRMRPGTYALYTAESFQFGSPPACA